jgi:hypothetical protein
MYVHASGKYLPERPNPVARARCSPSAVRNPGSEVTRSSGMMRRMGLGVGRFAGRRAG